MSTVPRRATERDLPRIAALARWVWLDRYADAGVTASFAGFVDSAFGLETLRGRLSQEPMWVIEEDAAEPGTDRALQAWMALDGHSDADRVELCQLYVAPPCQGRGLGARLLAQARAHWPSRPLWLSAWEGNADALRFYWREGATLQGETWFELDGQRHRNEVLGWPALAEVADAPDAAGAPDAPGGRP